MSTLQLLARSDSSTDLLDRLRERADRDDRWHELDATFHAVGDHDRLAQLIRGTAARTGATIERSFAVVRRERGAHDEDVASGGLRTCGRHYSLALIALVDALAAERSGSPLASPLPLDDLRAAAFFVAAGAVSVRPDVTLIDRAVLRVDRCLAELRMPLRATGYLAARDALRTVLHAVTGAGRGGGV